MNSLNLRQVCGGDTIRGLLSYQPDELESFTGVALTLILSALEQSTQATINTLKMVD